MWMNSGSMKEILIWDNHPNKQDLLRKAIQSGNPVAFHGVQHSSSSALAFIGTGQYKNFFLLDPNDIGFGDIAAAFKAGGLSSYDKGVLKGASFFINKMGLDDNNEPCIFGTVTGHDSADGKKIVLKAKANKKDVDALLKKELNWEQVNDKLEPYDVYIDGPVKEEGKTMFLARLADPKADSQEKDLTQPVEPVKTADGAASDETHPPKNTDADDIEDELRKLEEENDAALAEKTAVQHAPQPLKEALHGGASDETKPPKDMDTTDNGDGKCEYDPKDDGLMLQEDNVPMAEEAAIEHAPPPQEEAFLGVASDEAKPPKDIDTAANEDGDPVYDPENYEYVPLDEEDAGEEEAANGPQPMES